MGARALAVAIASVAAGVLGVPERAEAYCRLTTAMPMAGESCAQSGRPLYWKRSCITYSVTPRKIDSPPLETLRDVVDTSFATWLDVTCEGEPIALEVEQTETLSSCTLPRFDEEGPNSNAIVFVEDWKAQGYPKTAFGLTLVWHDEGTGEIVDADMLINETLGELRLCEASCAEGEGDVVDLQNVLTHEAGHFFGLGHSTHRDACMWGKAYVGETNKRELSSDDVEGICAIYGERAAPSCEANDFVPAGGFSPSCKAAMAAALRSGDDSGCSVASAGASSREHGSGVSLAMLGLGIGVIARLKRRGGQSRRALQRSHE